MRFAAKRDDTEKGIVQALEAHGWTVIRLSDKGAPDLLAIKKGQVQPFECKSPGGKLTPAQEAAFQRWLKAGLPVCVVTTPEEAVAAVARPVDGVLEPLRPVPGLPMMPAALVDAIREHNAGHVVTPAYQKAQTEAVAPKKRRASSDPPEYDGTGAREMWCKEPETYDSVFGPASEPPKSRRKK